VSPPAPVPSKDATLLDRLRAGDEDAFDQLVTELHPTMTRVAGAMIGPDSAKEVVQDTWAAVLDGLDRFEGRSTLKTWVLHILVNRARTWAQRAKRSVLVSFDDEIGEDPAVDPTRFTRFGNWALPPALWLEQTPEDLLLRTEAGKTVARELDNLPPAQRAVVALRDVEGCTSEEVCEILGLTEANQRVLLHRGRSKLRSAMERYLSRP